MNKVDYMKPSNIKRIPITDRTYLKRYQHKRIPTFKAMVRALNK